MKKKLTAVILCFCILFLTGCWDRKELVDLAIVGALGFDRDVNTGKIAVSCQIVRPEAMKTQDGATEVSPVKIITTTGDTVSEALVNVSKQFDKRVYFTHCKIIVLGQDFAEKGVSSVVDFLSRFEGIRLSTWVVVAKGTTARQLLGVNNGLSNIQAFYLEEMIKLKKFNSEVSALTLLEFTRRIASTEINAISGQMEIMSVKNLPAEEKKEEISKGVKFSGTAVFKSDKVIGYLDSKETRGLNWITDKMKGGVITIQVPREEDKLIPIRNLRASRSISPEIKTNGEINFNINIMSEGDIVEEQGTADLSKPEVLKEIEKMEKEVIEKEVKHTVDKIKNEINSDILGFGEALSKKYPKEWKELKNNWDTKFPQVNYQVFVAAKINKTGTLVKPILIKE